MPFRRILAIKSEFSQYSTCVRKRVLSKELGRVAWSVALEKVRVMLFSAFSHSAFLRHLLKAPFSKYCLIDLSELKKLYLPRIITVVHLERKIKILRNSLNYLKRIDYQQVIFSYRNLNIIILWASFSR